MDKKIGYLIKKIIVFENKVLRKVFAPAIEEGMWTIKRNEEIRHLYKDPEIIGEAKSRRLRWTGHLIRTQENSTMKAY